MSTKPDEEGPSSGERKQERRLKFVGSKVTEAPQEAVSIVVEASRVAYRYTSTTVRDLRKADLRFHTKPAELAQAIKASTQAKISDAAGTQIGRAGATAAGKALELAGTAASEVGNALGVAAGGVLEHGEAFRERCRKSFEPLSIEARRVGKDAQERATTATAAAWGALESLQAAVPTFSDLPPTLRAKFAMAGMHGTWRPVDVASSFYESGIPLPVRNLGEDAVLAFIDGKHASHIEAVVNAPGRMMDTANIVWEAARDNLARGGANMTPFELAKANALNVLNATGIVAVEALQTAAVAGCVGMALEGVVSGAENLIYVYKDEMPYRQAGRKVLKDMLRKSKGAAIGGAGMTVVVALGAGPALATAAPVLVTVGGVVYVVTAYSRIKTALDSTEEETPPVPSDVEYPALGTA